MNYLDLKKDFGKVKKIKYRSGGWGNYQNEETLISVMCEYCTDRGVDKERIMLINEKGEFINIHSDRILEVKRCVPSKELKEILLGAYKNEVDLNKNQIELNRHRDKVRIFGDKRSAFKKGILSSVGYLTCEEFMTEVYKLVGLKSERLYSDIYSDFKDYSIRYYNDGVNLKYIDFSREEDIMKWCREGSYDFLFEEYDSSLHIYYEDLEKSEDYKRIIASQSRKNYSFNGIKGKHDLGIGDKNTLIYSHDVRLEVDLEFKKENVAKVAQKIKKLIG